MEHGSPDGARHRRSSGFDSRSGVQMGEEVVARGHRQCGLTDAEDRAFVRAVLFWEDFELFRSMCMGHDGVRHDE